MVFVIVGCLALFFAVTDAVRVSRPELENVGNDENVLSGNWPIQLLGTRKNLPETDCTEKTLRWSLENTHVYSNLYGNGPDQGPRHEVRMWNVAKVNGVAVDLVVKNTSEYRSWHMGHWEEGDQQTAPEGQERMSVTVSNGLGHIHLRVDSEVTFRFAFMEHNTETEVEVPHFRMTWMDFDASPQGPPEREYLKFDTPISEPRVGDGVEMWPPREPNQFRSKTGCTPHVTCAGKDNPQSTVLDGHQKDLSVEFGYKGVKHWSLTLGHENKGNGMWGDRKFFFAGNIISCECIEKAITWSLEDGQVYSNLVGNGPDQGDRHEVRMRNVARVDGVDVDLVVKNISEYRAWSHGDWEEGDDEPLPQPQERKSVTVSNSIGGVLLHVDSETTFRFAFMKHDTEIEVELPAFLMTWMDFDSAEGPPEREYLKLDTAVKASWLGDKVEREPKEPIGDDIVQVQSTTGSTALTNGGKDNPTGFPLNDHQKQRSAEFCYMGVKNWDLTLGHIHKRWPGDRKFYFAGIRL